MFNLMALEKIIEHGLTSLEIPFHEPHVMALSLYAMELTRWNERINLVGLKGEESIVRELFYDAFFLYNYVRASKSVIDIGSGAGVLAIPLAILNGNMRIFSIDRTLKKIQFQRHVKRTLKLNGFYPVHGRIESLEPLNVQSLVAKAFGSVTDIITKGSGHIIQGGHAFLLKGKAQEPQYVEGFALKQVIPYILPDSTKDRTLLVYRKLVEL